MLETHHALHNLGKSTSGVDTVATYAAQIADKCAVWLRDHPLQFQLGLSFSNTTFHQVVLSTVRP